MTDEKIIINKSDVVKMISESISTIISENGIVKDETGNRIHFMTALDIREIAMATQKAIEQNKDLTPEEIEHVKSGVESFSDFIITKMNNPEEYDEIVNNL